MGIFDVSAGVKYLQEHGIPVFRFPENAAKSLGALYQYSTWLNRQQLAPYDLKHNKERAAAIIKNSIAEGKLKLGEIEGGKLLECYGFKILPAGLATTRDEAAEIAETLAFPVAMKIVSPQILHKSDAGGVVLGIENRENVLKTFDEIIKRASGFDSKAEIKGVLIQKMAKKGEEVILGMNRYPVFGPLIMFGLGGIFVELFQDVVFRLAPVGRNSARRMVRGIKGYKLFRGFRGRPVCDIESLEKAIVSLSEMCLNHPEILEMDINPLLSHEQGSTVADCRIIIGEADVKK
jgi:acetyltransferase